MLICYVREIVERMWFWVFELVKGSKLNLVKCKKEVLKVWIFLRNGKKSKVLKVMRMKRRDGRIGMLRVMIVMIVEVGLMLRVMEKILIFWILRMKRIVRRRRLK